MRDVRQALFQVARYQALIQILPATLSLQLEIVTLLPPPRLVLPGRNVLSLSLECVSARLTKLPGVLFTVLLCQQV